MFPRLKNSKQLLRRCRWWLVGKYLLLTDLLTVVVGTMKLVGIGLKLNAKVSRSGDL
jgi:hypothetical protein